MARAAPSPLVGFNAMSVLAQATTPPVSHEYRLPETTEADGNVTPLLGPMEE